MKSELEIIIAKNFLRLRKAHGFTLRGLAKEVGISHGAVQRFESLNHRFYLPPLDVMERLAEVYGIKVADFFVRDSAAARAQHLTGYNLEDSIMVINRHLANMGLQIRQIPNVLLDARKV